MNATQNIAFAVTGQTFALDAEQGPITSVTSFALYEAGADDTSTAEVATTGSASVDSVSTTLNAAADAQTTAIVVLSGTGITVDRMYTLAGVDGLNEVVDVVAKNGTAVTARSPLKNTYATGTGSTFKASRATIAIDSTWVAEVTNVSTAFNPNARYRGRWVVVIGGVTYALDRYYDLVRYSVSHGVTPALVERRLPGFLDSLPVDHQADQGRSLVEAAWVEVKMDLYNDNKADTAIRNTEALAELVIARLPLMHLENQINAGADVSAAAFDIATKKYEKRYDGMIHAAFLAVDTSGGGASQPNAAQGLYVR